MKGPLRALNPRPTAPHRKRQDVPRGQGQFSTLLVSLETPTPLLCHTYVHEHVKVDP